MARADRRGSEADHVPVHARAPILSADHRRLFHDLGAGRCATGLWSIRKFLRARSPLRGFQARFSTATSRDTAAAIPKKESAQLADRRQQQKEAHDHCLCALRAGKPLSNDAVPAQWCMANTPTNNAMSQARYDPLFLTASGGPDGPILEKLKAVASRAKLNCGHLPRYAQAGRRQYENQSLLRR